MNESTIGTPQDVLMIVLVEHTAKRVKQVAPWPHLVPSRDSHVAPRLLLRAPEIHPLVAERQRRV